MANTQMMYWQVYHKSAQNLSSKARHAYTFHVVETEGAHYASKARPHGSYCALRPLG